MASYGILGFMQGAGAAGKELADKAVDNQYKIKAEERAAHNEETRLRMAAALEQSQAERDQGYARENYALTRQDQVEDRDLTRGDLAAERERASKAAAAAAQLEAERYDTDHQRKVEIERMKQANKAGSYSDIMVGVNKDTGERDQYRMNNRTGEQEWLGVGVPTNPLDDAKLAKAQADAEVSQEQALQIREKEQANMDLKDAAIAQIDRILDPARKNSFNSAIGPGDSVVPSVLPGTKTMDNDLESLRKMIKLDKIKIMAGMGSLTEAEGVAIEKAFAAGLDSSSSQESVRDALGLIKAQLVKERSRLSGKMSGTPARRSSDQQAGASGGWGGGAKQKAPSIGLERQSELSSKYDI